MEGLICPLADFGVTLAEFFLRITWYSLEFVVLAFMAIFSQRYRGKLKTRWKCSFWDKVWMVLGSVLYICAIICSVYCWSIWLSEPKPLLPAAREKAKKELVENPDVRRAVELMKDWKKARDAKKGE